MNTPERDWSGMFDFWHAAMVPNHERFDRELAAAARDMQDEDGSRQAMDRAVSIATQILPGCDAAGVCVVHRGERVDSHATSHDALRQVDALQHRLKEGPCLDALRQPRGRSKADLGVPPSVPEVGPVAHSGAADVY